MGKHRYNPEAHDTQSRRVVINYLHKLGFTLFKEGSQFGIDLVSDEMRIAIELEHRQPFTDSFPYSTYHLPSRKRHRFLTPHNGYKTWFFVINRDFNRLLVIDADKIKPHITEDKIITVKCRGSYDDNFCHIPISSFRAISLN